jgi:hypothetical protein
MVYILPLFLRFYHYILKLSGQCGILELSRQVWYFGTVPTVWYLWAVPTVWLFGTVPTVWYFGTVPAGSVILVFFFILRHLLCSWTLCRPVICNNLIDVMSMILYSYKHI